MITDAKILQNEQKWKGNEIQSLDLFQKSEILRILDIRLKSQRIIWD